MIEELVGEEMMGEKLATNNWRCWMVRLILVDRVHQCGRGYFDSIDS